MPNEIVDIEVIKDKKNYSIAKRINILKESIFRRNACPYSDFCGGCDLVDLEYNEQLKYKTAKIKELINRNFNNDIKINDIIYDKIVPTIFEALYRVNKEIVKENVDVKLLKKPKEGGYYEFSGNEDLIIMQNSEDSVVVKNGFEPSASLEKWGTEIEFIPQAEIEKKEAWYLVSEEDQIRTDVELMPEMTLPVKRNTQIGKVRILINDQVMEEYALIAGKTVEPWTFAELFYSIMMKFLFL